MKFKLFMLSLLSLSVCSYVSAMDRQALTEDQIKQVLEYQNRQSRNKKLALLAGVATTLGTYNLIPVESFFEKYKEINPEWTRWYETKDNALGAFTIFVKIFNSEPQKYLLSEGIQNTIYALKALKAIGSLYAGYKAYKFVKNKLDKPANT